MVELGVGRGGVGRAKVFRSTRVASHDCHGLCAAPLLTGRRRPTPFGRQHCVPNLRCFKSCVLRLSPSRPITLARTQGIRVSGSPEGGVRKVRCIRPRAPCMHPHSRQDGRPLRPLPHGATMGRPSRSRS